MSKTNKEFSDFDKLLSDNRAISFKEFKALNSKLPNDFQIEIEKNLQSNTLIEMKQSDKLPLRNYLHNLQSGICPLLNIKIPLEKTSLDHKHKLKADDANHDNGGLVRGAIDFRANALEGKIVNGWKRLFGSDEFTHPITLPNYLRNLADYLENPPCPQVYIHPDEVKDTRIKASKNDYNRIKKFWNYFNYNKKIFPFPKSGYMTKEMKETLVKANEIDTLIKIGTIKKLKKIEIELLRKDYYKVYPNKTKRHIYIPPENSSEILYKTQEICNVLHEINLLYVNSNKR